MSSIHHLQCVNVGGCWKQRIGVLEDLCRRKDSVIFDLKQDILALESKVCSVLQEASLTISNAERERERASS
jgi:hypothetical protein